MQVADWALVISILSALISLASLAWNIWSKFIYPKPVLRVSFAMVTIMQNGSEDIEVLRLNATNMGPIEVTLMNALMVYRRHHFTDKTYGILNLLPNAPKTNDFNLEYAYGGGPFADFPKKLEVGETFSVYLVPDHETIARGDFRDIGFSDTFNREHWAPRSDTIRALPYIREACERSGKNWRKRGLR
ncbi:hypothetical protein [Bradyrhizobium sp. Ec3.3]|uniref:hypothetical protein n=1 Tax=Bradyrhizobium sp. Ec3.3 TaxID=189753 RepID=UPI000489A064|nr:hypothetical protein [Bradyrhizobium sp. Ec3.3]